MNRIKIISGIAIGIIIIGSIVGLLLYKKINQPNVKLNSEEIEIYIPSESSYSDLIRIIVESDILIDTASFKWIAEKKNLEYRVISGKYIKN